MDRHDILKHIEPTKKSENLIFIPNEIFDDIVIKEDLKTSKHIALAYCYYCLISYLYRFTKYFNSIPLTQKALKTILGYSANDKKIDYIIKRNGVLDKMGYIKTTTEIPINYYHYYNENDEFDYLDFEFLYDFTPDKEEQEQIKSYFATPTSIKYPVKAFKRDEYEDTGHFFEIYDTHPFDIRIFLHAMIHKEEIGLIGFYLYQFINRHEGRTLDIDRDNLSERTGIKPSSLDKYIGNLERYNYLSIFHQDFYINAPKEDRPPPNTYTANPFDLIKDIPLPKEELEIRWVFPYIDNKVTEYNGEEGELWGSQP